MASAKNYFYKYSIVLFCLFFFSHTFAVIIEIINSFYTKKQIIQLEIIEF